jgi:hypothetical protein
MQTPEEFDTVAAAATAAARIVWAATNDNDSDRFNNATARESTLSLGQFCDRNLELIYWGNCSPGLKCAKYANENDFNDIKFSSNHTFS